MMSNSSRPACWLGELGHQLGAAVSALALKRDALDAGLVQLRAFLQHILHPFGALRLTDRASSTAY